MDRCLHTLAVVRDAANRLCRANGAPDPGALLSLGLPATEPLTDGEGTAIESLEAIVAFWVRSHPDRRRAGLYLTPAPVAERLLRVAWDRTDPPRSVLDPAVGAGAFLLAARNRWGGATAVHGVDCDPAAVALARLSLWIDAARAGGSLPDPSGLARAIRWGDALLQPGLWGEKREAGGVDLVCGNPPFGNAIEKRTARGEDERRRLRSLFPEAARGAYDRSVLFVRLAASLLSPAGRLALLVPRALLAARYAAPLRAWLEEEAPLIRLLAGDADRLVPDAEIGMVGLVGARGARDATISIHVDGGSESRRVSRRVLRAQSWGGLLHPLAEALERSAALHPALGELFDVRAAATVEEAYRIVGQLRDGGDGWRFLTAGLLRRHHDLWGRQPARHLGRRLDRPILPREAPAVPAMRRGLYGSPKLIVSGLSVHLRARRDEEGECAGAIGTLLVLPRATGEEGIRLLRRADLLLNSAWCSAVHRCRNGPASLSGGSLPAGRRDLEALPFPRALAAERPAGEMGEAVLMLDEAAADLAGGGPIDEGTDARVQRAILRIAGIEPEAAEEILRGATAPPPARGAPPRRGS